MEKENPSLDCFMSAFLDFEELLVKLNIGSDSVETDDHDGHDHKRRKRETHENEGEHTSVVDQVNGLLFKSFLSTWYFS